MENDLARPHRHYWNIDNSANLLFPSPFCSTVPEVLPIPSTLHSEFYLNPHGQGFHTQSPLIPQLES